MVFGKTPLYRLWKGRMSAFWRRQRLMKLLRLAAVPEGARILEAGCGEGKDVLQFLTGRGYELWAADILERALPWEDVSFVRADAAELPFADGEFDLVITVGLLEHIEPHRTALRSRLVPPRHRAESPDYHLREVPHCHRAQPGRSAAHEPAPVTGRRARITACAKARIVTGHCPAGRPGAPASRRSLSCRWRSSRAPWRRGFRR